MTALADGKVRCDACPVMCIIKPGMAGACDRYANQEGALVRTDPHVLLERTLDDSANRRLILPEAFLVTDEIVQRSLWLVKGLRIWPGPTARNLREYGLFAATERVLMAHKVRGLYP